MSELAEKLAGYLATKLVRARDVRVDDLARIHGGASRETYRFTARWSEDGTSRSRPMILRRDPPSSLIETDRRLEFEAYRAFHGTTVPVPEPLFLESDPRWLDRPFS